MPHFQANDGAQLHVDVDGSGPPVILIHGFASSARVFTSQIEALRSKYTVYAPDLRGHGLSNAVDWGRSIARLSRDLHDLIEAERLDGVTLVGWSMGCSVIWSYLDLFDDRRVGKLAFLDEIPWVVQSRDSIDAEVARLDVRPFLNLHDRLAPPETRTKAVQAFIAGMLRTANDRQREDVMSDAARAASEQSVALLLNSNVTDWRDVVRRMRKPVLFVGGGASFFDTAFQRWMHKVVPGSRLLVREGAGHFLPIEEASWLNHELLAFLEETPSPDSAASVPSMEHQL